MENHRHDKTAQDLTKGCPVAVLVSEMTYYVSSGTLNSTNSTPVAVGHPKSYLNYQ